MDELLSLLEDVQWRQVPEKAVSTYHKYAEQINAEWAKEGYSPALERLAKYANLSPETHSWGIPEHPAPLTSMLVGGLAGAGLGYGLGWAGEKVLPSRWHRGRLRRTLATLGGLMGTVPGAYRGAVNMAGGDSFNDNSLFRENLPPKQPEGLSQDFLNKYDVIDMPEENKKEIRFNFDKASALYPGGGMYSPGVISVDEFNDMIWRDPRVAQPLGPQMQAAASGVVTGAANLPGKMNTRLVTPMDIGRLAAGMGTGYLSSVLVGKALGILMGMPQETQNFLKNTGVYVGILKNVIPILYGG